VPVPIHADLHLDTPTQMVRQGVGLEAPTLEASLPRLRAGGTNLVVEALWPPREGDWAAKVEALLRKVEAEDQRLEDIRVVRSPAEAWAAADQGVIGVVLALEGAHGIEREGLDGLRRLRDRGLSMLGLTWSFSNRFAGSSGDGGGGLTADGRALVVEAQRLGVMVDVSHASRQATLDTCALAVAPIVASHSNAAAVHAQARNLSDEEVECIARTGGVIGLNLHSTFVGKQASAARLAEHARHLAAVGGVGVLALGSDLDGMIKPPADMPDASQLPRLWEALRTAGFSATELAMIQGDNFVRAWAAAENVALQARPGPPGEARELSRGAVP
jgi:membrane dipeptidase